VQDHQDETGGQVGGNVDSDGAAAGGFAEILEFGFGECVDPVM
jgi:hypothetical protein